MTQIEHWSGTGTIAIAESKSGVRVTVDPYDNLVTTGVSPRPTPEILQKFYGSGSLQGEKHPLRAACHHTNRIVVGHALTSAAEFRQR